MDRFGEYSSQTYVRKLNSYVGTLEELGLDPEPRQYNLTKQEPPREKQGTKNVRKLRKEGPLPSSELPSQNFGVNDKRHGMASFSIKTGQHNKPESVFYLFDDHNPEEVLRTFLETHPEILENRSVPDITQDVGEYGQSWKKAARGVIHSKSSSEHLE